MRRLMFPPLILPLQDGLYSQHFSDMCHDAVRQVLGPYRALAHSR
jgi:hypothetical protein